MKNKIFLLLLLASINLFGQQRKNIFTVTNDTTKFLKVMPVGSIIYNKKENRAYILNEKANPQDNLDSISNKVPFSLSFNGNRSVKRSGLPQINAGGDNLFEWIENYFFPFVNPTISINGNVLYEIGTNNNVVISGSVTMNDEDSLTGGHINRTVPTPVTDIHDFDGSTSYSVTMTFNPRQNPSGVDEQQEHRYIAYTTGNECNCTIHSITKYVRSVYPYLYGVSSSDLEGGGTAPYTTLTKLIQTKSNKSVTLNGGGYIYFCYPSSYPDLTSILDQNGFEQITAFTKYTADVTSTGLSGNWTENYKIYKLNNTTTANSWTYQFKY